MSRKMPAQRPHRSEQAYGTPARFLDAVARRFGPITWDLAANSQNTVCGHRHFGPGSRWGENAIERAWSLLGGGLLWLNPPFENLPMWAEKCADEGRRGAHIALLAPAAVSTNWFAEHVEGHALVLPIRPRLVFVGQTQPYPKDLLLAVYGEPPGFETWRWDAPVGREAVA
jgi:phage N-6-adenine-methyltransferase